ncbi:MAG: hypothetical protein NT130_03820 [Candidatus Micrarchaeota archaeon]|nr:hypothetical protein [Candidatus Micrarchaeota archaeon]
MKKLSLLLLFLFLSVFISGVSISDVNLFVSDYLKENETFTKVNFNTSSGDYYIVSITDEPSFILAYQNGSLTIITSKDGIRNALISYYASNGVTAEDLKINKSYVDELLSLMESYNETRVKEFECKTYIGIDRFPCVDLDSCWRACYTPICQQLKIGAGKPFLELIWTFSNLSLYIDSNLSTFNQKVSSLSEFNSSQFDEIIALIDNMRNNSIAINSNDLTNPSALGFCRPVNYNLTYLMNAKIKLLTTRDRVLPLLIVDETADRIFNNTMDRLSMKSQLKIDKLCSSLISSNSQDFSLIKINLSSLNTSKINEKLDALEKSMKLEGCSKMNEAQMQSAQLQVSNLTMELNQYAGKLKEVLSVKNEVRLALAGMQGELMLSLKLGELNSRFNELNAQIDSAEFAQLPALETQLLQLKSELESANSNKPVVFITGIVTSPFVIIVVVLALLILFILKGNKKLSKK